MKRAFAPMLFAAALALTACGGQTGIEVVIEPASSLVPGRDFEQIRVTVKNKDGESFAEPPYTITELTEKPYRVFVLAGYEEKASVQIQVQLLKSDSSILKDRIFPRVVFEPGEMTTLVVEM